MTTFELGHALTLATCAGQLALCVVALGRLSQSPVAWPLAAQGLVAFVWNFAAWASTVTSDMRWSYLDWAVSPLSPAIGLHIVVSFVGRRRQLRRLLASSYAASASLSLITSSAFFSAWGRLFAPSHNWELAIIALMLPNLLVSIYLLARNLREQALQIERMRTELIIAAIVSSFVLAAVEVLLEPPMPLPATLLSTLLASVAVFRLRLFGDGPTALSIALAGALVVIAAGVGAIALKLASASLALRVSVVLATVFVVALLAVHRTREILRRRARVDRLALLGRMSSQIAHDIRNPLAAMKGAAQFLKEERAQRRSIDGQEAFLDLIIDETDRLGRLIDRYQRLRTLEPRRAPTDLNELVQQVVTRQNLHSDRPELRVELASELPSCAMDADLMSTALENLLVNARESLEGQGEVVVCTALVGKPSRPSAITVTVADTGPGMNPRELEQAFDEFYTTKATGSGLGLPLVRRVVDAHGGSLNVLSRSGLGTRVTIELPLEAGGS